jgi:hypothetical protein
LDVSAIVALTSSFLTITGVLIGAKWQYSKSEAAQLTKLFDLILEAAVDDKVADEEFRGIVTAAKSLTRKGEE